MFMVINRLSCAPEYAEHLERAFKHAGNMQGVPGFILFQFLKNTAEDGARIYIALTQWESQTAYEAWTRSESFQRAHSGTGSSQSPVTATLETYEVLA
ncbi:MAG TPA: antibiotic biosynthesis monooxygenase [Chloroflexota bacterium]|jgi:heme-degrading monooxygenase HmoA|nr:antibiotic biosynthesis monooxygenase [Chloroflexota bacterium]